jgi:hypothetical protein
MPDERETSFKVTDRRKFNADGSPRDADAEPEVVAVTNEIIEPQSASAEPGNASPAGAPSNVVSFPGETAKGRDTSVASAPSPAPAPESAPTPGDARKPASAAQSAADQAFSHAAGPRAPGVPSVS